MRQRGPVELADAAAAWRRDGFVVLPGYLSGPELAAAQRDLAAVYPSAAEYHAAPDQGANQAYTGDEFGGIITFPFPAVSLCRIVVHDKLVALAEAIFATQDIRIYASELWAKYTGAASYEQEHHRDYLNHTPLAPSADWRWRGLEMFIWLSDVPEDHGPDSHRAPAGDGRRARSAARLPALRAARTSTPSEQSGAGPPAPSSPTAPRPSTAAPRSPRPARPVTAPTSATGTPTTTGPAATPGATTHSARTGTPSSSRPRPASSSSSAFPRPATPTGPRTPSPQLQVRYPGLDTSQWKIPARR